MSRGLAIFLYAGSAVAAVLLSAALPGHLPVPPEVARPVGLAAAVLGLALAVWSVAHLRLGVVGGVDPVTPVLVRDGPYRFLRHPVYLGLTVVLAGLAFIRGSGPGLLGAFGLFLPSAAYRARLEERALASAFGKDWEEHSSRTGFLLPQRR